MPYYPKQGDIIILDFDPQTGHEQKGRRPGLIVSNSQFHKRTKMAMVCPITNSISRFPTHIALRDMADTGGEVMCEQVKCLDISARNAEYKESVSDEILDEAIDLICSFVE
ncbi:MAG: type II toxin-antitoxin system PemK/MazF family toxin [Clostridiales bacterium]|nr:type II toxin-antitoxin system PemK/MazF family toxin [Clostridiales bacterium]